MKKTLLLFLTLCLNFTLYAQIKGTIKGKVLDQASSTGLPFASVAIYQIPDSTLVNGTLADSAGTFNFTDLKAGKYIIKANYMGFTEQKTSLITISKETSNLSNTDLVLKSNIVGLDEVQIKGDKETMVSKIDRQVYRASAFATSQGGTAIDVLRNTPSISTNAEGQISLRGSTGFLVLINGRPVQSDAATILSTIPANSIENIEIITSPSASNDPDGKSGIVNITTKVGATNQLALFANVQGGLPSTTKFNNLNNPQRYGMDLTLTYRNAKWDYSLGGNFLRNDITGRRVGDVNTTINNIFTSFPSVGERSFKRYSYTGRGAITFTPNTKNSFSAGIYKGYREQSRRADITYDNVKTNLSTGQIVGRKAYFNSNIAEKSSDIILGNLDYEHHFNNKSNLKISGLYEYANFEGLTTNQNLDAPTHTQVLQLTKNPSKNPLHAYRFKADYDVKIGNGKLETGYQFRHQLQNGSFQYLQKNLEDNSFITIPDFTSDTRVTNVINAFYAQYSAAIKKLSYVGGLRYEYASRNFSANGIAPRVLNLSNLFPSVSLQYAVTPTFSTKASYTKRIQRSTNNELNPYPEREHSETLEQGDPDILPEIMEQVELGIINNFEKGSFFATAYYQNTNNVVNRINQVYTDTILNRIYTNAGKATKFGLELGLTTKLTEWWNLYAGTNVYNYKIDGSLFGGTLPVNTSSVVYSINANSTYKIGKSTSIQWALNYLSKRVTAQGEDSRFIIPSLAIKQSFMNGRLTANLQWQNINMGLFGTNQQRITTFGSNFFTTTNYIQETDIFLLNLSFNINKIAQKANLPTSEFGDREF